MDKVLESARRSAGYNRFSMPAREYFGDRPNLDWPAFLLKLFPGVGNAPAVTLRRCSICGSQGHLLRDLHGVIICFDCWDSEGRAERRVA